MTKQTRLIILLICALAFCLVTPYIILYSLGYRVNLATFTITATGGLYVRANPQPITVTIDQNPSRATGLLYSYVFLQNLLPGNHQVLIEKDGYHSYQKTLPVTENQVTKLEHVILFKKELPFTLLKNNVEYFYPTPDGNYLLAAGTATNTQTEFSLINTLTGQKSMFSLAIPAGRPDEFLWSADSSKALVKAKNTYYLVEPFLLKPKATLLPYLAGATETSFNPQNTQEIFFIKNANLYSSLRQLPIAKNVITYKVIDNTIAWLSQKGFLYRSDIQGLATNTITSGAFPIKKNSTYKLFLGPGKIFLKENDSLFLLNSSSMVFENFYAMANGITISPDGKNILYYNDHEILYYPLDVNIQRTVFLNRFSEKINQIYWLNNDYLIFNLAGKMMISEIDTRGNINTIELPTTLPLAEGENISAQEPEIFFNQQDKKIYLQAGKTLVSSEKIIP